LISPTIVNSVLLWTATFVYAAALKLTVERTAVATDSASTFDFFMRHIPNDIDYCERWDYIEDSDARATFAAKSATSFTQARLAVVGDTLMMQKLWSGVTHSHQEGAFVSTSTAR
jgi:hypothetical protein